MATIRNLIDEEVRTAMTAAVQPAGAAQPSVRRRTSTPRSRPRKAWSNPPASKTDPKLRDLDARLGHLERKIRTIDSFARAATAGRELAEVRRVADRLRKGGVRDVGRFRPRLRKAERDIRAAARRYTPQRSTSDRRRVVEGAIKPPRPLIDKPEAYVPDRPIGWSTGSWFTGGQ